MIQATKKLLGLGVWLLQLHDGFQPLRQIGEWKRFLVLREAALLGRNLLGKVFRPKGDLDFHRV